MVLLNFIGTLEFCCHTYGGTSKSVCQVEKAGPHHSTRYSITSYNCLSCCQGGHTTHLNKVNSCVALATLFNATPVFNLSSGEIDSGDVFPLECPWLFVDCDLWFIYSESSQLSFGRAWSCVSRLLLSIWTLGVSERLERETQPTSGETPKPMIKESEPVWKSVICAKIQNGPVLILNRYISIYPMPTPRCSEVTLSRSSACRTKQNQKL